MKENIPSTIQSIKARFRERMNGTASRSMSQKGVSYKINWGISLPDLKAIAAEYEFDLDLVIALWKENVRECKLLAMIITGKNELPVEIAEIWMSQIDNQELAEMLASLTLQYQSYAEPLAFLWISSDKLYNQICGYNILSRLFLTGNMLDERGINEFLDQAAVALKEDNAGLRRASYNALMKFSDCGDEYLAIAKNALASYGINDFL